MAAYLPKCLDSLVNQTFKDIDIVTVNNGSADDTLAILRKYAATDSRIKVIDTENSGLPQARNLGLDSSDSEYVMFCDADDWYSPQMCQIMHEAVSRSGADVACCQTFLEDAPDLGTDEKRIRHDEGYYRPKMSGKYRLTDKLILKTNVMVWNKIWRRDLLKKHGVRFPEIRTHEDDCFWYMYAVHAKTVFYVKERLYHYLLRPSSIMSMMTDKNNPLRKTRLEVAKVVMDYVMQGHSAARDVKKLILDIFLDETQKTVPFLSETELLESCEDINRTVERNLKVPCRFVPLCGSVTNLYSGLTCAGLLWQKFQLKTHYCVNRLTGRKISERLTFKLAENDARLKFIKSLR